MEADKPRSKALNSFLGKIQNKDQNKVAHAGNLDKIWKVRITEKKAKKESSMKNNSEEPTIIKNLTNKCSR